MGSSRRVLRTMLLGSRWGIAGGVYGAVVVMGTITAGSAGRTKSAAELAVLAAVTVVVLWLAHVYAHSLGESLEQGRAVTRRGSPTWPGGSRRSFWPPPARCSRSSSERSASSWRRPPSGRPRHRRRNACGAGPAVCPLRAHGPGGDSRRGFGQPGPRAHDHGDEGVRHSLTGPELDGSSRRDHDDVHLGSQGRGMLGELMRGRLAVTRRVPPGDDRRQCPPVDRDRHPQREQLERAAAASGSRCPGGSRRPPTRDRKQRDIDSRPPRSAMPGKNPVSPAK